MYHSRVLQFLCGSANRQPIDAQSGLTDTHWYALAFFAAGAHT
jgi:hypothetical protein